MARPFTCCRMPALAVAVILRLAASTGANPAAPAIELRDGDRVVLIGPALIEREPHYAFWESAVVARLADRNIVFRNLGWSGDTVFGVARASFDPVAKGFERLIAATEEAKPTVILLAYGLNESFDGAAGLEAFLAQYNVLLDRLAPLNARLALITPMPIEPPPTGAFNPPPDPASANKNIDLYSDAIRKLADARGLALIDLHAWRLSNARNERLTDNTMHLTAAGYRRTADFVAASLGAKAGPWRVSIRAGEKTVEADGTVVRELTQAPDGALSFELEDKTLPLPPLPSDAPRPESPLPPMRELQIVGLGVGIWELKADGVSIAHATAEDWAKGVEIDKGPDVDQAAALRDAIRKKNELFFHRWRPQNETYLFGFRKHEQGQNAKEIPEFDPLVEKADQAVAALRTPKPRKYQLVRSGEKVK